TPLPDSSNVNFRPGAAVANSAIVALSADGAIELFASSAVAVIVDVTGVFVPVSANVAAGRFTPLAPSRLADTRLTADRRSGDLVVPIPAGVPPDATALAVSVTLTDTDQPTYVTVYPAGGDRPTASVVNTDPLERARAVTLLAPISRAGLALWRSAPSNVIVDVVGWFTGPSARPGSDGLFVADGPRRMWDSRSTNDPLHAGGTAERSLTAAPAAAAVINVTAVDATAPGFVSAFPAGMTRPEVSMLNVAWRSPLASMSVVPLSSRGAAFYASVGVHMVVDVAGWFLGAPVATAGASTVANPMPSSGGSVLFVSDSSLAGIRWNADLGWLQGANFVAELESCRRLIGASCRGREGYAPENAVQAVLTAPGSFDTLVIGTGYDDFASLFAQGFDAVVRAARTRGIARIVWFDYRELVGYSSPGHVSYAATFAANNATLRTMVASGAYPEVTIAGWNGYSASRPRWFTADGVHVTGDGTQEAAMYLSRTLAFLDRRPCPAGMGGPVAPGGWCASPDLVGPPA
ncbi:MAG TPA: hypothetical protein VFQ15_07145, partial [Jiangellaceae bacterium]|nr:hypothetical protein [Jiangellaceae bacterium]